MLRNLLASTSFRTFIVVLLVLSGTLLARHTLMGGDQAYMMSLAQATLEGKKSGTDIIEMAPMSGWLHLPPALLSRTTGLSVPDSFFLWCFIVFTGSVLWCWHFLALDKEKGRDILYGWLPVWLALVLIWTPAWKSFGQREHLFVALALPYLFLCHHRLRGGKSVPKIEALLVGLVAGAGIAMKPHFLLLPVACELMLLARRRQLSKVLRPESIGIFLVLVAYYAALVFLFPETVRTVLPIVLALYPAYYLGSDAVFVKAILLLAPVFLAYLVAKKGPALEHRVSLRFFLGLVLACIVIFASQSTGFHYQTIPCTILTAFTFYILVLQNKKIPPVVLAMGGGLLIALGIFYAKEAPQREEKLKRAAVIAQYAKGKPAMFLSASVEPSFPLVTYAGARWAMRTPHLFYLPALYAPYWETGAEPPYRPRDTMSATELFFYNQVIEDALQDWPAVVVVDEVEPKQGFHGMKFNFLTYYLKDARFRQLWRNYEFVARAGTLAIYRRKN